MERGLYMLTMGFGALCIAAFAGFLFWASDFGSSGSGGSQGIAAFAFMAFVFAFGALPYALAMLFARANREWLPALGAALLVLILLAGFAVREYHNAWVVNPDPQSALILLFLPAAQIILTLPLFAVGFAVKWWRRRR
jgi:glucan phosphoethanolaminetransferase (alkaline phosphatase superfamily)